MKSCNSTVELPLKLVILSHYEELTVCTPLPPLTLKHPKPKHFRYPIEILTIGDELRKERMDRGLTQHQVSEMLGVNRNVVYEVELNRRTNTIYALNKISLFLKYIPKTLNIDKNTLQGKLIAYRIWTGKTYLQHWW